MIPTTRRNVMGTSLFAALAGAAAFPAAASDSRAAQVASHHLHPDAALIELCASYVAQETAALDHHQAELRTPGLPDDRVQQIEDEVAALCAQADKVLALVIATPATTMDGLAAKARCAVAYRGEIIGSAIDHPHEASDRTACLSIIRDLVGQQAIAAALRADGRDVEERAPQPVPDPDAEILALCNRLDEQQAEWQRLWTACEEDGSAPDADAAFEQFENQTWPGIRPGSSITPYSPDDLPQQLIGARPTTPEGLRAMARAALALEAAGAWADIRDDHCQIMLAVVRAAAGVERMPLGDGSAPT